MKQKEETKYPMEISRLQIVNIKVTVDKLKNDSIGKYYKRKRREIRKKLNGNGCNAIINVIPDKTIEERWIVETLMYLQREFTDLILIPNTTIPDNKLEEFIEYFKSRQVLRLV